MKKVTIIGANSYIARNMVYLINHKCANVDLRLYDLGENQLDGASNYKSVNILDKESLKELDLNCDVIFLFTGKTGSANGFDEYDTFIDVNEKTLLNVLAEYRRQNSEAKLVFPSTRLVYKGEKGPLPEDAEKEFKTVYAINKFACEKYLEMYHAVYGINYCTLRICIPYGTMIPGASSYGTAEFMLSKAQNGQNISLYGDGSVRRTLTYMGDLCETMLEAALCEQCVNDVYNIGGEDYSLREMATLIARKYEVGVDYVEWPQLAHAIESGDTVFDDKKIEGIIDFRREYSFKGWIERD